MKPAGEPLAGLRAVMEKLAVQPGLPALFERCFLQSLQPAGALNETELLREQSLRVLPALRMRGSQSVQELAEGLLGRQAERIAKRQVNKPVLPCFHIWLAKYWYERDGRLNFLNGGFHEAMRAAVDMLAVLRESGVVLPAAHGLFAAKAMQDIGLFCALLPDSELRRRALQLGGELAAGAGREAGAAPVMRAEFPDLASLPFFDVLKPDDKRMRAIPPQVPADAAALCIRGMTVEDKEAQAEALHRLLQMGEPDSDAGKSLLAEFIFRLDEAGGLMDVLALVGNRQTVERKAQDA